MNVNKQAHVYITSRINARNVTVPASAAARSQKSQEISLFFLHYQRRWNQSETHWKYVVFEKGRFPIECFQNAPFSNVLHLLTDSLSAWHKNWIQVASWPQTKNTLFHQPTSVHQSCLQHSAGLVKDFLDEPSEICAVVPVSLLVSTRSHTQCFLYCLVECHPDFFVYWPS